MGNCPMNFAWSYEKGPDYDFRCCGGSHTTTFKELGIPEVQIPGIRQLFRRA